MRYRFYSLMTEGAVIHLCIELNLILYIERNVNKVHLQLSVASQMPPKVAYPLD